MQLINQDQDKDEEHGGGGHKGKQADAPGQMWGGFHLLATKKGLPKLVFSLVFQETGEDYQREPRKHR
jgi:hypothetical protein